MGQEELSKAELVVFAPEEETRGRMRLSAFLFIALTLEEAELDTVLLIVLLCLRRQHRWIIRQYGCGGLERNGT